MSGSDKRGTLQGRKNWAGRKQAERLMAKSNRVRKCASCGTTICLQIDHKDGDTSNNSMENLQYLCRPCHTKKDADRWGWKGKKAKNNELYHGLPLFTETQP